MSPKSGAAFIGSLAAIVGVIVPGFIIGGAWGAAMIFVGCVGLSAWLIVAFHVAKATNTGR